MYMPHALPCKSKIVAVHFLKVHLLCQYHIMYYFMRVAMGLRLTYTLLALELEHAKHLLVHMQCM